DDALLEELLLLAPPVPVGSHASPIPSLSPSACVGFAIVGQLSQPSPTPSASKSAVSAVTCSDAALGSNPLTAMICPQFDGTYASPSSRRPVGSEVSV